jgi:hypothetical protein
MIPEDNEFYYVTFENSLGLIKSVNIHLRHGETIFQYMQRVYGVGTDNVHCIYQRIYTK